MLPSSVRDLYRKYERWVPIVFFLLGFAFDAMMLRRIDELGTMLQQAAYLAVSGLLIGIELIEEVREVRPPALFARLWKYREAVLHFLLGTLLNSYTIFYFKSASALSSFIFILILIALLMLNEFKRFGKSQSKVHVAFFSLCLVSYLLSLAPILLGFAGMLPFLCSVIASLAVFYGCIRFLRPRLGDDQRLRSHLVTPFAGIQGLFIALYFLHAIPPVPLSVKYMGIFHDVKKVDGKYELYYARAWWRFWQHGDQTFRARPGDHVVCFAQIFSPTRFREKLQIRWLFRTSRGGWYRADAIPMPVTGGRAEGYRAVTIKSNIQPGFWRVQVETADGREVGRIRFNIEPDESSGPREMKVILR